jgi:glyoxylase-like metal-dependent hydrolase (beta-lactamase superfamily II)
MDTEAPLAPGVAVSLNAAHPERAVGAVRRIVAPNAGLMTGPGTNTYVLGTRELTVLDPGPDDESHLAAILAACSAPIRWIAVTHTHRDHSPLARRLKERTRARLIGVPPPADGRQDDGFEPQHVPEDGERLHFGDVVLTAIRTPGHASNCVCYLLETERLLFTGDHVLRGVSPVILPPDGDMSAYLDSLEKLLAAEFEFIAPGHGGVMADGKRVVVALREHRLRRESKVLHALARLGAGTLDRLTPPVYDDVPADRHVWARLTLEAHLIKLERDGRVSRHDDVWRILGA